MTALERKLFPGVEKAFKRAIQNLIEAHPVYCQKLHHNVDLIFEWWISKQNMQEFIAMNEQQLKLPFETDETNPQP